MIIFCFNDCIPKANNQYDLVLYLGKTLTEYSKIKNIYPEFVDGIITNSSIESFVLNQEGLTLHDCIKALERDLKRLAYRNFTKYPIDHNFKIKNIDALVEKEYSIRINEIIYCAINAQIVFENDGVLFSLALHKDLMEDVLRILDNENNISFVNNLYGNILNTNNIIKLIEVNISNKLDNLSKLLKILGDVKYSERFKKSFDKAISSVQNALLEHLTTAIKRNGLTPLFADGDLIKDVTPQHETKVKVFELRIFNPVAYRLYFYETNELVYLGLFEQKPTDLIQDVHIKCARDIIKELVLINNN